MSSGSISGAGTLTGSSYSFTDTGSVGAVLAGAGSLTKSGSGTVTVTSANTYTGATTISNGSIALSGAGSIADSSAVSLSSSTAHLSINAITAATETIGSLAGAAGSTVTLGSKTLEAGGDNSSTTFAGVASGTGGLKKTGTGTMTLSGANNYTGENRVAGGKLLVNGNNAAAAGNVVVESERRSAAPERLAAIRHFKQDRLTRLALARYPNIQQFRHHL